MTAATATTAAATSTDANVSNKTRVAVLKYGRAVCLRAYRLHVEGEGASTIAQLVGLKTTQQADAAINAGEEMTKRAEAQEAQEAGPSIPARTVAAIEPTVLADMARTLATLMQSAAELARVPAGAFVVLFHGSALRLRCDGSIGLGGGEVAYWMTADKADAVLTRFAAQARRKGAASDADALILTSVEAAMRRSMQTHADIADGVLSNLKRRGH